MADDFEVPGKAYIDLELAVLRFARDVIPPIDFKKFIDGTLPSKRILEVYFCEKYDYYVEYVEGWAISLNHDAETDINNRIMYFRNEDMTKEVLKGRIVMSIYHEISHVILGHTAYASAISGKVARGNYNRIPIFRSAEWQAEAMASALAMPFPATLKLIIYAKRNRLSDEFITSELVDMFHVSRTAAMKRISNIRVFIINKGKALWLLENWNELERSLVC